MIKIVYNTIKKDMPRCKNCKDKFERRNLNQKYCMTNNECISLQLDYLKELKRKSWRKEKKKRKDKLKTNFDHIKELQSIFNKFIRLRDKNEPCISCQRHHNGQYHAGHYRTTKHCPELRFDENNCHKQCSVCNNYMSGNILEYRINLIKKIGLKEVVRIEGNNKPKNYSIEDIKELKEIYKKKIKEYAAITN